MDKSIIKLFLQAENYNAGILKGGSIAKVREAPNQMDDFFRVGGSGATDLNFDPVYVVGIHRPVCYLVLDTDSQEQVPLTDFMVDFNLKKGGRTVFNSGYYTNNSDFRFVNTAVDEIEYVRCRFKIDGEGAVDFTNGNWALNVNIHLLTFPALNNFSDVDKLINAI